MGFGKVREEFANANEDWDSTSGSGSKGFLGIWKFVPRRKEKWKFGTLELWNFGKSRTPSGYTEQLIHYGDEHHVGFEAISGSNSS
jgi:hypothetical protein